MARKKRKNSSRIFQKCDGCQRIHQEEGNWQYQNYAFSNRPNVQLVRGFCLECAEKFGPKFYRQHGHFISADL